MIAGGDALERTRMPRTVRCEESIWSVCSNSGNVVVADWEAKPVVVVAVVPLDAVETAVDSLDAWFDYEVHLVNYEGWRMTYHCKR